MATETRDKDYFICEQCEEEVAITEANWTEDDIKLCNQCTTEIQEELIFEKHQS